MSANLPNFTGFQIDSTTISFTASVTGSAWNNKITDNAQIISSFVDTALGNDEFGAGHASTSISAALGMAHARDQMQKQNQVLAIIGDGALTGGLAYEGINNLGYHRTQLTIVLNDNSMSISKSVGALSKYLNRVVTNPTYTKLRNDIWYEYDNDLSNGVYIVW